MNNILFLSLGSNLGDRESYLRMAKEAIAGNIGEITGESSVYESEPWGFHSADTFLNQVIKVRTGLFPEDILHHIKQIEALCDRVREKNTEYGSRTLDIDILLYNDTVHFSDNLIIPHPRMEYRKFVLLPLSEIDPEVVHPVYQRTIRELLEDCADNLTVSLYKIK